MSTVLYLLLRCSYDIEKLTRIASLTQDGCQCTSSPANLTFERMETNSKAGTTRK